MHAAPSGKHPNSYIAEADAERKIQTWQHDWGQHLATQPRALGVPERMVAKRRSRIRAYCAPSGLKHYFPPRAALPYAEAGRHAPGVPPALPEHGPRSSSAPASLSHSQSLRAQSLPIRDTGAVAPGVPQAGDTPDRRISLPHNGTVLVESLRQVGRLCPATIRSDGKRVSSAPVGTRSAFPRHWPAIQSRVSPSGTQLATSLPQKVRGWPWVGGSLEDSTPIRTLSPCVSVTAENGGGRGGERGPTNRVVFFPT